jgi:Transposase DDE domain
MKSLLEVYCDVDDFMQVFKPYWHNHLLAEGSLKRVRVTGLSESEIMTIVIHFHQSQYRTFKAYYTEHVQVHLRAEFPQLVSYTRFVELMARLAIPLAAYLKVCFGVCTGISFIDSTALAVCENRRIGRHRVFRGVAQRGKSSLGWFYGFKLHLVTNDRGELLAVRLTPGNVDDRQPVPEIAQVLFGKLFGDRGYLSQPLFEHLLEHGVHLITHLRKNMPNRLIPLQDKLLLRRRTIIETINDQLKNISQIEHSPHRSLLNCLVNLLAGLIAYCHQPKKPSLHFRSSEQAALLAL